MEFNKMIFVENINYLIGKSNAKIGEIENEIGVSTGYISRISKDDGVKPGIDFIINIASYFKVSVDVIVGIDLSKITPTEQYLITFIEKLILDTSGDKLGWIKQSKEDLNNIMPDMNGYVDHPLFSYETFFEKSEVEYPEEISRVVFLSDSFGANTYIEDDAFTLRLKNGSMLYLMSISKSVIKSGDTGVYAKELWIDTGRYNSHIINFLCGGLRNPIFEHLIENLYSTVKENLMHPKLDNEVKYVIDAFLQDDLEDDKREVNDWNIPF